MKLRAIVLVLLASITASSIASCEVVRIVIDRREDVLGGRSFGAVGPYEKIVGRVFFVFDPANPMNSRIVDLDKAPRNADGMVEAWANFMVLRPKADSTGTATALLEVSNRGGKAALSYFNFGAGGTDPTTEQDFGDGLLMRLGLTVIWVGWQWDVPMREGLLRLHVPIATDGDEPLEGLVRADWTVDRATNSLALGHRNHVAYPTSDTADARNVLTVRDGRLAPRSVVPRSEWQFARLESGRVVPDPTSIHMESGFEAGKIYELVYVAQNPRVVGLGLAAVRDMMSYAKYDSTCVFPVARGVALGISQTGRFLRHFVYQGFNTDEQGRKVFDGLMIHTAGAGRGSFNHRFAQPSRDAHRYSAFFYPTDIFPFSSSTQYDPESGVTDGLFAHPFDADHLPKIFFTNTGYEYWGRAASLIHTSVDGTSDLELLPNERIYNLASGQHFVGTFPPPSRSKLPGSDAYRGNPLNFLYTMRSLVTQMLRWLDGTDPPPSTYPRIDAGQLVSIDRVNFPSIPGVDFPTKAHEAYRVDYGPRWEDGIIDIQPPTLGTAFPVLVPQVDEFGNDVGGVPTVEILAPLATYTPWNLRIGYPGGTDELTDFTGTYIPLPRNDSVAEEAGDARPSISSMYRDKAGYLTAAQQAAELLVAQGFLLQEDVAAVVQRSGQHWDWVTKNGSSHLSNHLRGRRELRVTLLAHP
jgi:hypothetical protein